MLKKGCCLLAALLMLALSACGGATSEIEPASASTVQSEASAPESAPAEETDAMTTLYHSLWSLEYAYTKHAVAQNGVRREMADYREQSAFSFVVPYALELQGGPIESLTPADGTPAEVLPGYETLPCWAAYGWGTVSGEENEWKSPEELGLEFYFGEDTALLVLRRDDETTCYTGPVEDIAPFFDGWEERFAEKLAELTPDTRAVDSPEVLEALVAQGFPREAAESYLKHLAAYHRGFRAENLLASGETDYPEWYLQEQSFIADGLKKNWTRAEMRLDTIKATGEDQYAASADGTKYIFTAYDGEEYACFGHTFWHDMTTGETKLVACELGGTWFYNKDDGLTVLLGREFARAFDIETGEPADDRVPRFDFGQETRYGGYERSLVGGGYDPRTGCWLYLFEKEFGDAGSYTRAVWYDVFDRDGRLLREADSGLRVPMSIKNFYLYADPVFFRGSEAVITFAGGYGDYTAAVNYLGDTPAALPETLRPVAMQPAEVCALLEGEWRNDYNAVTVSFAHADDKATYQYWSGEPGDCGPAGIIESAERRSPTEYRLTVRFPAAEGFEAHTRELWVDTGAPKDDRISLTLYDEHYLECVYQR